MPRDGKRSKSFQLRELLIQGMSLQNAATEAGAHVSLARAVYCQLVAEGLRGPAFNSDEINVHYNDSTVGGVEMLRFHLQLPPRCFHLVLVPHRDVGLIFFRFVDQFVKAETGRGLALLDATCPEKLLALPVRLQDQDYPSESLALWVSGAAPPGGDEAVLAAVWEEIIPALLATELPLPTVLAGPPVLEELLAGIPGFATRTRAQRVE